MSDASRDTLTFFENRRITLEEIKTAGWEWWGGTGGWYGFEHRETGERYPVPHWIRQLVDLAEKRGEKNAQTQVRRALGLKVKEE